MELITIYQFNSIPEAYIIKARLESEDISCFLFDENTITANPLYANAIGGVRLKVKVDDFEKANLILKELEMTPYTDQNNEVIQCPKCRSTDLFSNFNSIKNLKGFFSAFFTIIFGIMPFYFEKVYRCKKCDYEFKLENIKSNMNF